MKSRFHPLFLTVILVSSIIMLINCGNAGDSQLIGKWILLKQNIQGKEILAKGPIKDFPVYNFFQDHTVSYPALGLGKWTLLGDGRVKMDWMGMEVRFGSLKGGNLIITDPSITNGFIVLRKIN